ncbi:hypothetical protein SAY87_005694 [Trapa incisa]|uniref:FLZ-type domain-containing protein n=1 Tax=Trapa incisa TaxID=236973 RepID=A0AAN7Q6X3_9MYRT|nr:hypothetical protein SAY87_005694 [Trapa incisa]
MASALRPIDLGVPIPSKVEVVTSARGYTPPQYLTLHFTLLSKISDSGSSFLNIHCISSFTSLSLPPLSTLSIDLGRGDEATITPPERRKRPARRGRTALLLHLAGGANRPEDSHGAAGQASVKRRCQVQRGTLRRCHTCLASADDDLPWRLHLLPAVLPSLPQEVRPRHGRLHVQGFCSEECRDRQIFIDEMKELEFSTNKMLASSGHRCSGSPKSEARLLLEEVLRRRGQIPARKTRTIFS